MFGNKTEPCSAKNGLCNLEKASQFCKKLIWKDVHSGNEISLTNQGWLECATQALSVRSKQRNKEGFD